MVYSTVNQMMPSNGFGSPVSPPDLHFECREVPSPSQYSDPSFSPPSLHSPPHFLPDQDTLLKEEPLSPYNGYQNNKSMLGVPNKIISQADLAEEAMLSSNIHHQAYMQQQLFSSFQNNQMQPLLQVPKQHHTQQPMVYNTQLNSPKLGSAESNFVDYELLQLLNNPEMANTMEMLVERELMLENASKEHISMTHVHQPSEQNRQMPPAYSQTVMQQKITQECQQSDQNQVTMLRQMTPKFQLTQLQQQPQQQATTLAPDDLMKLKCCDDSQLNPEVFTTISVPFGRPEPSQESSSDRSQCFSPEQMYPTFESLIDDGEIEPAADVDSDVDPVCVFDSLMKSIYNDAGVSHNPYDWSVSSVRSWLKAAAKTIQVSLPESSLNLNIDGKMLLSMSPEQFASVLGCKNAKSLLVLLDQHVRFQADEKSGSNNTGIGKEFLQVKQEALSEEAQILTEMSSSMIPTSVVNHKYNAHFTMQPRLAEDASSSALSVGNHHVDGDRKPLMEQFVSLPSYQHQQQKQQQQQLQLQPQPQQISKVERSSDSGSPTYSSFQVNQTNEQRNANFSYSPTSTIVTNSGTSHLNNNAPSLYVPSPAVVKQATAHCNMTAGSSQAGMVHSPNGQPVPLQDGINGYVNDSGADLSALLQQQSPQHPATLDPEESMDTDDVEEDVPASSTGGSGRSHIQLWQFLKELLDNNKKYGSCIRWLDRQEAIFKIEDSVRVATLWGERKNRPQMNYDKLSRSIRQYYNKNIMKKTERSQRLVYQFCAPYGQ
ncbi:uncharacterized protein LOC108675784 isoform X2 [Hyalella azteca]|uniref:Uncharacterized protein LOC108675784 isoform X2 n=1 Tax=Hyalella azteca TaxID=294128 RepID=A0A8B7P2P2_HYAAZ|nr:uncharacterized protein LOC108675784 isoform X2 [Hyalella azteca]